MNLPGFEHIVEGNFETFKKLKLRWKLFTSQGKHIPTQGQRGGERTGERLEHAVALEVNENPENKQ